MENRIEATIEVTHVDEFFEVDVAFELRDDGRTLKLLSWELCKIVHPVTSTWLAELPDVPYRLAMTKSVLDALAKYVTKLLKELEPSTPLPENAPEA